MHLDDKVSCLQNLDLSSSELMVRYWVKDLVPSTFVISSPLQNCHTSKIALIAISKTQLHSKHSTFFSLVESLSHKFFITKFFLLLIATSFINLIYYFYKRKPFTIPPTPLLVFHTLHVTHGYHFLTSKTNLKPSHKVNGSVNSKHALPHPRSICWAFFWHLPPCQSSSGEFVGHLSIFL